MTPEVAIAEQAARAAAEQIRAHDHGFGEARHKGAVDLVTELDLACERRIREVLSSHTPDIPVLGEEGGGAEGAATRWVVDPIDGTTNFVHGFPYLCTSIALEVDGEPIAACILDPFRDMAWTAAAGRGARCGERPVRVSSCRSLDAALVATGFPYDRRSRAGFYLARLEAVMTRCQGIRRAGAAALDLAMLADGRVDAFWEFHLKRWDVAAGALLIREAGGRFEALGGGPLVGTDMSVIGSNGWLHDELAAALETAG